MLLLNIATRPAGNSPCPKQPRTLSGHSNLTKTMSEGMRMQEVAQSGDGFLQAFWPQSTLDVDDEELDPFEACPMWSLLLPLLLVLASLSMRPSARPHILVSHDSWGKLRCRERS